MIQFSDWTDVVVIDSTGRRYRLEAKERLAAWLKAREDELGVCWIVTTRNVKQLGALLRHHGVQEIHIVVPDTRNGHPPRKDNSP